MNKLKIELPAEYQSGNGVEVERATIKRERMVEIIANAVEADRKRRGEPVACFKCGHAKHGGECVNVAPQPLSENDIPAEPVEMPSDDEIDAVFNEMPDGMDGWIKTWGCRQFARTILARFGGGGRAIIQKDVE